MTQGLDDGASEFASPAIQDSRRLTGPNRFADEPGAVIDVEFAPADLARSAEFVAAWRDEAVALAERLGWTVQPAWRLSPVGVSCFVRAPVDALMSATELNEQAWARGEARVRGPTASLGTPVDVANAIGVMADRERLPHLADLVAHARTRGVTVLIDQDSLSLGTGATTVTWSLATLPSVADVAWPQLDRIPVALVTGSNGKTTTVRMLAAILREAVGSVAVSSTTGVYVDGALVGGGDYSGPAGARLALRDARARAAVLETARGGLLRRGLAMFEADVAVVTNVAADHFGDYGIHDLEALAEVKLVVARAVRSTGTLVLNADDDTLRALGPGTGARVVWFGLDPAQVNVRVATLATHDVLASQSLAAAAEAAVMPPADGQLWRSAEAWTVVGDVVVRRSAAGDEPLMPVANLGSAMRGAARHNVANALAAAAAASALGVPLSIVRSVLARFGETGADNPGRLEHHRVRGVDVVLDYAHNAAAVAALLEATARIPARRRAIVIGTAGDRTDEALRALARAAWMTIPVDLVVAKELPGYARGRELGEMAMVLASELSAAGAMASQVLHAPDEPSAVEAVMAWSEPGDLVLLTVHQDRDAVLAQLGVGTAR